MKTKILIVDDDAIIRSALRLLVESFESYYVIGEAENGIKAVELTREHTPDIVLMDLLMPVMDGIDATRGIKSVSPGTKVIALTVVENSPKIAEGLAAGIDGYLLKKSTASDLKAAIPSVMAGKRYICPQVAGHIIDIYFPRQWKKGVPAGQISSREKEVLELLCEGKRTKDIAEKLNISINTVEKHRNSLLRKYGAKTSAELTSMYMKSKS
jgi:DNA-binding NarL/FixJ family response regulator